MPPYGLYSLADTPEELLSRGYGYAADTPVMNLSEAEKNIIFTKNDPAFGNLNTDIGYFSAPFTGTTPFQNALFLRGDRQYGLGFDADINNPSFGGVSGYRNTGGIMDIEPDVKSVMNNIDFGTSEDNFQGFTDKEDFSESKTKGGIADFFRTILGFAIPGGNFFLNQGRNAMDGIRSLNQRLRNTDFGQSRTGAEYMMRRRERKQAERAQEAMPDVYRSAREQGFTNDRGGFSTSRADRAGTSLGSGQFSSKRSTGRQGY